MKIIKSTKFAKVYKKLHTNQLHDVNVAIRKIIENPGIGEQKIGDFGWLRVYKFKMLKQLTLIGYSLTNDGELILTLIAMGSHENFYRDLKN